MYWFLNLAIAIETHSLLPQFHLAQAPIKIAHEVKVDDGIGGTIHIDPYDRPIAGKKSRVWIALTKRGGEIVPYSSCNCQMEIQSLSDRNLKFTSDRSFSFLDRFLEQFLGLPSVSVVFPQVGRYALKLTGTAKNGSDFQPFELVFTTNVSRGS
jgi:hypothetical protein